MANQPVAHLRNFVVTVDDEHLPRIAQVADQLRAKGMTVESMMVTLGLISGSACVGTTEFCHVPGVMTVEEQPQFELPPSDADVQ